MIMKKVEFNYDAVRKFQSKLELETGQVVDDCTLAKMMNISKTHFSRVMTFKRKPGYAFIMGAIGAGIAPKDLFIISNLDKVR